VLADPKIAMSACYPAGTIGFGIFLTVGALLLVGAARRLLRAGVRGCGGLLWAFVAIPG